MAPREYAVRLPTHRAWVLEWGPATGPLLVALHGFPETARTWRRIAPLLADAGYRVAAPFLRGYAPSGIPIDGDYSVRALMNPTRATLRRWLSAVVRQPRHSWYIAFNQVPGLAESRFAWLADRLWRAWAPGYDAGDDLAQLAAAVPDRAHARAVVSYYRALPGRGTRPALVPPCRPLLYLQGDRDAALDSRFFPIVAGALPPGSASALVHGSGHFPQLEQPAVTADHIVRFLGG